VEAPSEEKAEADNDKIIWVEHGRVTPGKLAQQ